MPKHRIDALISEHLNEPTSPSPLYVADEAASKGVSTKRMKHAKWILMDRIRPRSHPARENFPESSLAELAQSIQEYGFSNPS